MERAADKFAGSALDFIARLAALVPRPSVNLTRFQGVFAQGKAWQDKIPAERRASMTWMQRLKRVFNIDLEVCEACGGSVKGMACIEDPVVIKKIRDHLGASETQDQAPLRVPETRAPPIP